MLLIPPTLSRSLRWLTVLLTLSAVWVQGQTPQRPERPRYVEGEVIVTFKEATSERTAKSMLDRKALRFTHRFREISAIRRRPMGVVRNQGKTTMALIQELKSDPTVESVEPNYLRYVNALPNDTRFNELWALRNTGQKVGNITGTSGADVKYEAAWAKARAVTGEVVVGVIDTGLDYTHPDLLPRMWINPQEIPNNNIDDDGNGYKDDYHGFDFENGDSNILDVDNHGTHVAGIIGAQGNNNAGVIGINDRVKLMALKVSSDGDTISTSAVVDAIEYAIAMKLRGVPLVALNASYGGPSFSNVEYNAISSAGAKGIIVCAAAGNDSQNNNATPTYPASYPLNNIITVAATDQRDALADFSNYGSTTVDLAAPGENILSTVPVEITLKVGNNSYETLMMTFSGTTTGLTGQIISCGIGYPADFPPGVSGNIALIERGTLDFSVKVANAKAAGAVAAVIYNNGTGLFGGTLQTADEWIPALSLARADGLAIQAALPTTGSLISKPGYRLLDGTSMATPQVTGAVAFAAMNFPNETMLQRVQRILSSVDVKPGLQGKVITGGRLNLSRVVDANQDGLADWLATDLPITNPPDLRGGLVGEIYAENLVTSQGTAPYHYQLIGGTLPEGLTLAANGELSGTPTQAGSSSFIVMVTDSAENSGGKVFSLTIASEAPQITAINALPGAMMDSPYSLALTASGGTAPYTWSVSAGNLPAGLTLSSAGMLSGFPSALGLNDFTLRIVDAHQLVAEKELSLTVTLSPISILAEASLPYGVKLVDYHQILLAEGGTEPYTWTRISGSLPSGVLLSAEGVLSGKPKTPGLHEFRVQVRDAENVMTTRLFTLNIHSIYTLPTMNPLVLDSTYVGADYRAEVQAENYPKSYKLTGLPKGLTYSTKTGLISGRPKVSGDFTIQATAKNPAGTSEVVMGTLTVRPLDTEWIGKFTGIISRDSDINQNLGSRLTLTTTSLGAYTVKVTTGSRSQSARGFLSESDPQVNVPLNGHSLSLRLDPDTQLITGTHGTASVEGWRIPWNAKTNAANDRVGYYSAAMKLTEEEDKGQLSIPQGAGYLTLRINTAGIVSIVGRTAAGDKITGSGGMGPGGETALYQSLYKHKGSMLGDFTVNAHEIDLLTDNNLAGSLSWLKPADTSRIYGNGFGPLSIVLSGGYLAPKSSGSIVQGLPQTGASALGFTDGGLAQADMDPNVAPFDYSSTFVATLPKNDSLLNPSHTTLKINKATGAITGNFTLVETDPPLKRKVSFQGMIVPLLSGGVLAEGYFLLPQIPVDAQKSSKTPILSGGLQILPSTASD